ncbi:hypothetical protein [uncultured Stenotrophomonas sp.]|uniref:hypothetical protein n=1 Tax=uncultured Stenotrophomonas sp. TaxID=165438 RepID=UPI0025FEECFE|nr:hypothetical protein [uncultured Stenotrophomonas sp.]
MIIKFGARLAIFTAVSAGLLVACGQPPRQVVGKADSRSGDSSSGPGKATEGGVQSTFKWDGDGSSLSYEQHKYLADLSSRYNGIFAGLDGKPKGEVDALGFPTSKEWLDAKGLTDEELLKRARQGDVKAKAFYVDRGLVKLEGLLSSSGAENLAEVFQASPAARDEYQKLAIDTQVAAAEILKFHPSPFAAYLFGQTSAVTGGMQFPIAASMAVAGDLGDTRSPELLQAFSNKVGAMDSSAVMSSYNNMRNIAGLK